MKKKLGLLLLAGVMILGIAFIRPAKASPVLSGYNIMETKSISDAKKAWTIKFTIPVNKSTVNNNTIYITDEYNQPISTTLSTSADGMSVTITPVSSYTKDKEYRVYVTSGLRSQTGTILTNQVVRPFICTSTSQGGGTGTGNGGNSGGNNNGGDYGGNKGIVDFTYVYDPMVTMITVKGASSVYTIKINGTAMQYQGSNIYKLGIPQLSKNSTVKVETFDSTGTLIEAKDYLIN